LVISFGIIGFLLAINFIAFWCVAPCNLVDYRSVVGENVTWAACNSVMYFDLYASAMWFGDRGSRVVNVLCYKSEYGSFDPRWRQCIFPWHKTSDLTVFFGTTLPLTEKSTRNISWWWRRTGVRLTSCHLPVHLSINLGPLTSWKFLGLTRPIMGRV
jgi:hypothetical protein